MHTIGWNTAHIRFNTKTNGLQITQEKLKEGTKLPRLQKVSVFLWSDRIVTGNISRAEIFSNKKLDINILRY